MDIELIEKESPVKTPGVEKNWLTNVSDMYHNSTKLLQTDLSNFEDDMLRHSLLKEVHVAGFKTSDKYLDEEALKFLENLRKAREERKKQIVEEMRSIALMTEYLQKKGIEPIAVLPSHIFRRIVESQKLYIFKNITADSMTNGEIFNPPQKEETVVSLPKLRTYGFWNPFENFLFKRRKAAYAKAIQRQKTIDRERDENIALFYRNIKQFIWPHRTDHGGWDGRSSSRFFMYKINLPIPPESIGRKLQLCDKHGIKPFVVLDEEAFTVSLDEKVFEKLTTIANQNDPIICYEWWDTVAIIDQFGDFPGEKAVMKLVTDHFVNLRKKLFAVNQN